MSETLRSCGTVLRLEMTGDQFAEVQIDMAGPELRRLLEAYKKSLPPKQLERLEPHIDQVTNSILERAGQFSVVIEPVMNMKVLNESHSIKISAGAL